MENQNLFDNYKPLSKSGWIERAIDDLKGAKYEGLTWQTPDDIIIQPFYTREDLSESLYPTDFFVNIDEDKNRYWENLDKIEVKSEKTANEAALAALNAGADGIIFDLIASKPDLNILLEGILLPHCKIYFTGDIDINNDFLAYARLQNVPSKELRGGLLTSFPIGKNRDIVLSNDFEGFKLLFVDVLNGNSYVGQLVDALQKTTNLLDVLTNQGLEAKTVFQNLIIKFDICSSYFFEIAKIRALRVLLAGVAAAYEVPNFDPASIHIHCQTVVKIEEDKNKNLIRNTSEAMSAILGGCNSLYTTPHDQKEASRFSRTIARNVSLILKEEAYFDKVADPAAGSFYLESLTRELAEKAWQNFVTSEKQKI